VNATNVFDSSWLFIGEQAEGVRVRERLAACVWRLPSSVLKAGSETHSFTGCMNHATTLSFGAEGKGEGADQLR
jgi:hypothetical protein